MQSLLSILLTFAALTLIIALPVNSQHASKNQGPIAIPLKRNNVGAPDAKSGFKELALNPAPLNNQTDLVNKQIVLFSVTVSIGLARHLGSLRGLYISHLSWPDPLLPCKFFFGEGNTVAGDIYTDVVTMSNTAVDVQSFGVAESLLTPDSTIPGDGIMGLPATDRSNPSFFESFLDNAFQYGSLTQYIFSLYMPQNGMGELLLGSFNTTQFTGDLTYLPVGSETLIQLDRHSINTLYSAIPSANRLSPTCWLVPCNQISSFTMKLGGVKFQIPGTSISQGPVSVGSTQCLSAITGGAKTGHATLGMAFLKNYYMVFDKSTIPFHVGLGTIT
ncbi:hypothetical protein BGZ74_001609 [Mortierella antarctica]|nr:hypothetical protein BGZ74_001609 [Mortierella antarctica]